MRIYNTRPGGTAWIWSRRRSPAGTRRWGHVMARRTEADRAPTENPLVLVVRPWHAPEFYLMDVESTAGIKTIRNDAGPSGGHPS